MGEILAWLHELGQVGTVPMLALLLWATVKHYQAFMAHKQESAERTAKIHTRVSVIEAKLEAEAHR